MADTNPTSPLIVLLEDLSNAGKSGEATEVRYDRKQEVYIARAHVF